MLIAIRVLRLLVPVQAVVVLVVLVVAGVLSAITCLAIAQAVALLLGLAQPLRLALLAQRAQLVVCMLPMCTPTV